MGRAQIVSKLAGAALSVAGDMARFNSPATVMQTMRRQSKMLAESFRQGPVLARVEC